MPLGILTDEEFEQELNRNTKKVPEGKIIDIEKGRGQKTETPESARKLISELAISGVASQELSQEFGISSSSISAYKNDANSTASYNEPNKELKNHNNQIRERIIRKARKKLVLAVDKIDDDKLDACNAKELAGVAKDMSSVIRNLEPEIKPETESGNNQFIFFAPHIRKESDYPIINVSD